MLIVLRTEKTCFKKFVYSYGNLILILKITQSLNIEEVNKHKIYFGTQPNSLKLISELQDTNICPSPQLKQGQTYYWRVDALHEDHVTKGEVWNFTISPKAL